jgi:hypothetical protein
MRNIFIASAITSNLLEPITAVAGWHPAMLRATVPETAIDKQGEAFPAKRKIRLPRKRYMPSPADYAIFSEEPFNKYLRLLISSRANRCHDLRTLILGEYIGHKI